MNEIHSEDVSERAGTHWGALSIGLIFFFVGLLFAITPWGAYMTDRRIVASDNHLSATVTGKHYSMDAEGSSEFIVDYEFTLPGGEQRRASYALSKDHWLKVQKGDSLDILYSAANPSRNFPRGYGVTSLALVIFLSVFGSLFTIFGALLIRGALARREGNASVAFV